MDIERIAEESEAVYENILVGRFDDPSRNGEMASKAIDMIVQKSAGGLWIDGSEGCGRHNTAYLAVQYLGNEYDDSSLKVFFLWGNELEDASYAETEAFVKELIESRLAEESVCLVIDASDGFENADTLLRVLSRLMLRFQPNENETALIVILIGGADTKLPSVARDLFIRLILTKPSLTARARFAEQRWESIKEAFEEIKYDPLIQFIETARLTKNLTFCELKDVTDNMYLRELVTDYGSDLDLYSTTEFPQEDEADDSYNYLTDMMRRVMEEQGILSELKEGEEYSLEEQRLGEFEDRHRVSEALTALLGELPELLSVTFPQLLSQLFEARTAALETESSKRAMNRSRGSRKNNADNDDPEGGEGGEKNQRSEPTLEECTEKAHAMTGAEIEAYCSSVMMNNIAASQPSMAKNSEEQ